MIRTLIVAIYLVLYVALVAPWFLLHAALTGNADLLYRVGVAGARFALRLGGIRVRVEGREHVPAGVCVFVANHTSNVDPPAVVGAIPKRVALLAKHTLFRVPILGQAMRLGDFVPVNRANLEAARASVDEAIRRLRGGLSFLVYPEGTRSPDGRLRPFKKGSFVMAVQAGAPIVPISVAGAQRVMRKGGSAIHPGEIVVRFHPPVPTADLSLEQKDDLAARVHSIIAAALPNDQRPA